MPSVSTRMRSPWKPRRIGREADGPNEVADTPGSRDSVSPIVGRRSRVSASPERTEVPCSTSRSLRATGAVTMMSPTLGWRDEVATVAAPVPCGTLVAPVPPDEDCASAGAATATATRLTVARENSVMIVSLNTFAAA